MSDSPTLSATLLAHSPQPLQHATQHPFLSRAGAGTLPAATLTAWLAQDTHYTRAYVRFLGHVLAALPLPFSSHVSPSRSITDARLGDGIASSSNAKALEFRVFDCVTGALVNIQREMAFFEDTAREYGIQLGSPAPSEATKAYQGLFQRVGAGAAEGPEGLLKALVLLWGTEHVYLTAWRFARSRMPAQGGDGGGPASRALRERFIPNWTSGEFEGFVEECKGLMDELGESLGIRERTTLHQGCLEVWEKVLEVEREFWPAVDEA